MSDFVHRDDLPFEVAEDLIAQMKEMFPGMKNVRFAGDIPEDELPEEVHETVRRLEAMSEKSLKEGSCIDCGRCMDNYPDCIIGATKMPDGWRLFHDTQTKEPKAFQCHECDARDGSDRRIFGTAY